MGDLVAYDLAEVGVAAFLGLGMANSSEVEIRAVADVYGVFIRPPDEAVILIFCFHDFILVVLL